MKYYYFILLASVMCGCFSSSVMQTAKPLNKGENQISLGWSGYSYRFFSPELMYRIGINSSSDIGLAYSVGRYGHIRADYKHTLWHTTERNVFLSSGLGADLFLPAVYSSSNKIYGVTIPFYFSFNHNKKVVPYFAQRFTAGLNDLGVFKHFKNDHPSQNQNYYHSFVLTGGVGVQFEIRKYKWFAEASYANPISHVYQSYYNLTDQEWVLERYVHNFSYTQFTIGVMIDFKKDNNRS